MDELSAYEEKRLELEERKLTVLKDIKKDIRHQKRMTNLYGFLDQMDVNREDIEDFIEFVGGKISQMREGNESGEDVASAITEAIRSATSQNVDVTVESVKESG